MGSFDQPSCGTKPKSGEPQFRRKFSLGGLKTGQIKPKITNHNRQPHPKLLLYGQLEAGFVLIDLEKNETVWKTKRTLVEPPFFVSRLHTFLGESYAGYIAETGQLNKLTQG